MKIQKNINMIVFCASLAGMVHASDWIQGCRSEAEKLNELGEFLDISHLVQKQQKLHSAAQKGYVKQGKNSSK